jgi:hypothetical protein
VSFLFSALLFLIPTFCSALDGVDGVTVVLATVYMGSTASGAYVKFSPAKPGFGGCTYTAGDLAWIDFSAQVTPNGRDVYATALAAYLAGHTIGIGVNGCSTGGVYPLVTGINVYP